MTLPAYKLTLTAKSDTRHLQRASQRQPTREQHLYQRAKPKINHSSPSTQLENTPEPADTYGAKDIPDERTTTN